ncbi:MAG: hypothetical protein WC654_07130 [Patescibacteria group bacterium]
MAKRRSSDEVMRYAAGVLEVLELFDGRSNFMDRLNALRRKWGFEECGEVPFAPKDYKRDGSKWSPNALRAIRKYEEYLTRWRRRSAIANELQRQAGLSYRVFQGDIAEICHDFVLWYPTWGCWIELLLVTNLLIAPPENFVTRVEDRPTHDPWASYYPKRIVLELSDTTSAAALKTAARPILDAQAQAYGKRRIPRKSLDVRLSDYFRRVMQSRGDSMMEIRLAVQAPQQRGTRTRGLTATWKDRERKREQAKRQRRRGASGAHPSTRDIPGVERGNKEAS